MIFSCKKLLEFIFLRRHCTIILLNQRSSMMTKKFNLLFLVSFASIFHTTRTLSNSELEEAVIAFQNDLLALVDVADAAQKDLTTLRSAIALTPIAQAYFTDLARCIKKQARDVQAKLLEGKDKAPETYTQFHQSCNLEEKRKQFLTYVQATTAMIERHEAAIAATRAKLARTGDEVANRHASQENPIIKEAIAAGTKDGLSKESLDLLAKVIAE